MKKESNESVYMIHIQINYSLLHEKRIYLFLYFFKNPYSQVVAFQFDYKALLKTL